MGIFGKEDNEEENTEIEDEIEVVEKTEEEIVDETKAEEDAKAKEKFEADEKAKGEATLKEEEGAKTEAQKTSKFILGNNLKPLLHKGKKILKKYKEGKFTVIETEDGATYKNI